MSVLAIAPEHNSPGKKDATGAFLPEAREFVKIHGGSLVTFDNREGDRGKLNQTLHILKRNPGPHQCVAFFMHGFKHGLQCGARLHNVSTVAQSIKKKLAPGGVVVLYACDAARDADADREDDSNPGPGGVGGFASKLSVALGGVQVDAHTTAGHTTWNPFVRRFAGPTGEWIVEPRSKLWRPWRKLLREDREFRLSFPFLSIPEIHSKVSAT